MAERQLTASLEEINFLRSKIVDQLTQCESAFAYFDFYPACLFAAV